MIHRANLRTRSRRKECWGYDRDIVIITTTTTTTATTTITTTTTTTTTTTSTTTSTAFMFPNSPQELCRRLLAAKLQP